MSKRILYVEGNTDGTVGGSYLLMLDLILGLDRSRFDPLAVFRFDNFVADRLRAAGVPVFIIPPRTPLTFTNPLARVLLAPVKKIVNTVAGFIAPVVEYAGILRRERIDLVNLNNSITRNHPWAVAAMLTGTPCITHEMGINRVYSPLSVFLGQRMRAVISLSHCIHDAMRQRGADLPNVTVIHCGIDTSRYRQIESPEALRARHGIPGDAQIIGVVGNLRTWKGQETIVRAMPLLRQRFPNLYCVLVGGHGEADKPYVAHLHALCDQFQVADRVVFAGFQQNSIDYMRLMDIVVHTSIDPEPFGIVTLEAMSLGKPLVSTTIGGPAEVVLHGQTGLLVDPGKPDLLAEAIATLLADPQRAAAMGTRGLERLHSEFALEKNLTRTMQVYERVLGLPAHAA